MPLIAHIERYPYVLEDPTLLYDWVAAGAYAQINAGALLEPKLCKKLCKFIQWGLVHVISTDTHSPDKRPPRMAQGVQQLEKLLGKETAARIVRNGEGLVSFDPTGRLAGRGAYVCSEDCLAAARKTRKLERALRCKVTDEDYERVLRELALAEAPGKNEE